MIHEEKCYVGTCDNCGETFVTYHDGFSMFSDKSNIIEGMNDEEWYVGYDDSEHKGKHYCPNCFKHDEEIDDKITVDFSHKKN